MSLAPKSLNMLFHPLEYSFAFSIFCQIHLANPYSSQDTPQKKICDAPTQRLLSKTGLLKQASPYYKLIIPGWLGVGYLEKAGFIKVNLNTEFQSFWATVAEV